MIERILEKRHKNLGGFEVGRVLPSAARRMVGPFIFFDEMGPAAFEPGLDRKADVRPHPHIGLATVTYLFDGEITHRDSVGSEQAIRPGAINWMTAGKGITHSERFEHARRHGGRLHGLQTWVALPDELEEAEPSFTHHPADDLPLLQGDGAVVRILLGRAFGRSSPVKTHSPTFYQHWILERGAVAEPPSEYAEGAAYVVSGEVEVEDRVVTAGQMMVFDGPADAPLRALEPSVVVILGGDPVGQRFIDWNFVSSSRERIEQAKADWRAGRIQLPQLDHDEFIPLPDDLAGGVR